MKKSKKHPPPPDQTPISGGETGGNSMMDLLMDMSSRMEAMEEFMSQHNLPQGPIPKGSSDQARHDGAAGSSSAWFATGFPGEQFDHHPEGG